PLHGPVCARDLDVDEVPREAAHGAKIAEGQHREALRGIVNGLDVEEPCVPALTAMEEDERWPWLLIDGVQRASGEGRRCALHAALRERALDPGSWHWLAGRGRRRAWPGDRRSRSRVPPTHTNFVGRAAGAVHRAYALPGAICDPR